MVKIPSIPKHVLQKMHLFILWLISKRKMHGYEMIRLLKKEGMKSATPSRLYPLLNQMLREKLISQKYEKVGKRIRKIYALDSKGKDRLKKGRELFSGLMKEFLKEMIS